MYKIKNPANQNFLGMCAGIAYVMEPGDTLVLEKEVALHLLGQARRTHRRLDLVSKKVAKPASKKKATKAPVAKKTVTKPKKVAATKPKKVAAKKPAAPKKVKAKKADTKPPRRKKK